MEKLSVVVLFIAFVGVSGAVSAAEELLWWGNSGTSPVADSQGRSGHWWWPSSDATNDEGELRGNRGVVFSQWKKPVVWNPEPPYPVRPPSVIPTPFSILPIMFDFDQAALEDKYKVEIDKLVAELKKFNRDTVILEGHTCSIGPADYNEVLGQRRADAVKAYMVEQGVKADRIRTISSGESKPAVPSDSPANCRLNRRVSYKIKVCN